MKELFSRWYRKYFSHPEAIVLLFLLIFIFVLVNTFGNILAPIFAGLVIAYLLEWCISGLSFLPLPRWIIFSVIYFLFLGLFIWVLFALIPLLWKQLTNFIELLPSMMAKGGELFAGFIQKYSKYVSEEVVNSMSNHFRDQLTAYGQHLLSVSIHSIPNIISVVIYLFLVPLLVFFMLFDKDSLIASMAPMLPEKNNLIKKVWRQLDIGIGNYLRGRVIEIIIVSTISYIVFYYLGLQYASLLAVCMGLSVLLPYIGFIVVFFPVALVAFFQWGATAYFLYSLLAYMIIMFLDGNVLAPFIFSEAINIHPVIILIAILVFGGIWGLWGVFFAIPLTILIKAIINLWPVKKIKCRD